MAGERMTFVLQGRDQLSPVFERASRNAERLRTDLDKIAPMAALPAAAAGAVAGAKLAAALGSVAAAAGAFGAAVAPQVKQISEVTDAQEKWRDAVAESGAQSEEAAKAQLAYVKASARLPPATRESAAALLALKDAYRGWSDSLADDTMPVVTKSFQALSAVIPRLTPLVKSSSRAFDRLITVAAGGIATPGLDRLIERVAEFSEETLHRATFAVQDLIQELQQPAVGGGLREFMEFAERSAPVVRETLINVASALGSLAVAAGDTGLSVLAVANALAEMVNAIPQEVLSTLVQLYATVKLLGAGFAALGAASALLRGFTMQLGIMSAAASTATGAMARVSAATAVMSAGFKRGLIVTAIALLAVGVKKLADNAKGAAPDIDRMTTALMRLSRTGKFTGELKNTFADVDGLVKKIKQLRQETEDLNRDPDGFHIPGLDDAAEGIARLIKEMKNGETSITALEEDFGALDKSLAGLVKSGHADVAAKSFRQIKAAAKANNISMKELNGLVPKYRDAMAQLHAQNELAADGMGVFGEQALRTKAKLDAQKASADGLRQAIIALNETNRDAYDAQIAFEQGVDDLTAAFKENGHTLNLNTEAGRKNGAAMSAAAKAHDEMIAAGIAAGESLSSMTGKSDKLRARMFQLAAATNMSDKEAREYVNTLLGTPGDIKTMVKLERRDALKGLHAVQRQIDKTPGRKAIKVDTLNSAAIAALEAVGLKTRRLPDGRTEVRTKNGQSLGAIGAVRRALNNLDGKTASTFVRTYYTSIYKTIRKEQSFIPKAPGYNAQGGPIRKYASGGSVQGFPSGGAVQGPGTSTSDSILSFLSDGEYVIRAAMVQRYGESFFDMLNRGSLPLDRPTAGASDLFERGGRNVGREVAAGLRDALPVVRDAARRLGKEFAGQAGRSGFDRAVTELNRLVDSGRWNNKGSRLFEDMSFQGMSGNFSRHLDQVADGFWAAVNEIKAAVSSGRRVHEDMTFKGMSKNVLRFHDAIAQIWKGNPYGRNFGDWGRFGKYGQYATGGHVLGAGTGTSDSILARISNGEYVVRAAAVRKYGTAALDDINQMRVPARTTSVGRATAPAPQTNTTTFNVYPQRADFTVHDLEALQRRADVRARVGRPR